MAARLGIHISRALQQLRTPGWQRPDRFIAATLFLLTLISRIPFRSHYLNEWDSANFALGMIDFDPVLHRPHPPGYPLYIIVGRIFNPLFNDANATLVFAFFLPRWQSPSCTSPDSGSLAAAWA